MGDDVRGRSTCPAKMRCLSFPACARGAVTESALGVLILSIVVFHRKMSHVQLRRTDAPDAVLPTAPAEAASSVEANMAQVLRSIPPVSDPNVILGAEAADDAAVYRVSDDYALVLTTDFFTPIVDDPYDFGRIAAANALSDVYAMGGKPFAGSGISSVFLRTTSRSRCYWTYCGVVGRRPMRPVWLVVGGHTIDDPEPKYGMAVTGSIHPDRVVTIAGARVGDRLIPHKADWDGDRGNGDKTRPGQSQTRGRRRRPYGHAQPGWHPRRWRKLEFPPALISPGSGFSVIC